MNTTVVAVGEDIDVGLNYPLQLAWSYLFLGGYLARVAFNGVKLPGAVGIFCVGYFFSFFMQADILVARANLQGFAFFLVLLNAGAELSVNNMQARVLVMAIFPALLELAGIALYAKYVVGLDLIASLVLANVMFPLGEGLVIPKMNEFKKAFPGHPLPNVVLTWAPLEATLALTLWGFFEGLAHKAGSHPVSGGTLLLETGIRIGATALVGIILGRVVAWALSNIGRAQLCGRKFFAETSAEAFLIVLGVCLGAFGLGEMIPIGISLGSNLFNPELFVIVTASSFAHFVNMDVLHGVETFISGIWVFGSIILFSMMGSKTRLVVFKELPKVFPLMLVGLLCRFVGMCLVGSLSRKFRKHGVKYAMANIMFCFLSSLPRATIQGALGPRPLQEKFFAMDTQARQFINITAKLMIVLYSVIGSILLELLGPVLLKATDIPDDKQDSIESSTSDEDANDTDNAFEDCVASMVRRQTFRIYDPDSFRDLASSVRNGTQVRLQTTPADFRPSQAC